ncbi:hypothetical protein [Ralstonia pseudosolanacearum]
MKTTISAPSAPKLQCQVEQSGREVIIRYRIGCWHTLFDWLLLGLTLVAMFIGCVLAGGALSMLTGSMFYHQNWLPSEWWRDVFFIFGLYALLVVWFLGKSWPGKAMITVTPDGVIWGEHQIAFNDLHGIFVSSERGERYSYLTFRLENKATAFLSNRWTKRKILLDVGKTIMDSARSLQPEGSQLLRHFLKIRNASF